MGSLCLPNGLSPKLPSGYTDMTFTWNEIPARTTEEVESSPVSVFVVSTRPEFFESALATARELSSGLGAQIEVLETHVVPYPLDLDHPAVAPSFLEGKMLSHIELDTEFERARILLCRDEADAVLGALSPKSIVVLGANKHWWRTKEDSLAAKLRQAGHQVVMAYANQPVRKDAVAAERS